MSTTQSDPASAPATVRLAVAQTTPHQDHADPAALRRTGAEIVELMEQAHRAGARLLHLPEGTLCWPSARRLSPSAEEVVESDWSSYAWVAQQTEIDRVAAAARRLRLWTVLGAPYRTAGTARPWLSLLVLDDEGRLHARYDERLLSRTKGTHMYEAGTRGVVVEVHGVRFGLASGLEALFPDVFSDYESEGADAVLYSTAGPGEDPTDDSLATSVRVHARHNGLTVSYAVHADRGAFVPAGVIGPDGGWLTRCEAGGARIAVTDVAQRAAGAPREWRRATLRDYRAASA